MTGKANRPRGTGHLTIHGYVINRTGGNTKFDHVLVAERALGDALPDGVVVHHVNEDRQDNRPCNLVICRNDYHQLIHKRMRAKAACGNASWIVCRYCGIHDDPLHLSITRSGFAYHATCKNSYVRAYRAKIRTGVHA